MSMQRDLDREAMDDSDMPVRGSNFLVSAVMVLRHQREELENQVQQLQQKVALLERQNASFMDISARRLIHQ
jgi:hypothetical protein